MRQLNRKHEYKIIEALDETDPPKPHEKRATKIIAEYFQSDVKFIRRSISSSPDIYVVKTGKVWEIKSPTGGSKRTIANNLRDASDQSKNVFLNLSRINMNQSQALSRVRDFVFGKYSKSCHLKQLKVITKDKKIIDIL